METQCNSIKVVKLQGEDTKSNVTKGRLHKHKSPFRTKTDEIINKYLPTNEISFSQPINPSVVLKNSKPIQTKTDGLSIDNDQHNQFIKNPISCKPRQNSKLQLFKPDTSIISEKVDNGVRGDKGDKFKKPCKPTLSKAKRISEYLIVEDKNVRKPKSLVGTQRRQQRESKIKNDNSPNILNKLAGNGRKKIGTGRGSGRSSNVGRGRDRDKVRSSQIDRKTRSVVTNTTPVSKRTIQKPAYIYQSATKKTHNNKINISELDPYYVTPDKETMNHYLSKFFKNNDYYHPDQIHKMISLLTYQGDVKINRI